MTRLCLVRHGETDWNVEGRYQGQSDTPLNQKGRAQAEMLARELQSTSFAAVYTSDLERARETAAIIAQSLRLPVTMEPRLREIHQGAWEGKRVQSIKAHYSALWHRRTADPAKVRPPGGETVEEVATRVHAALTDIATTHYEESILVVSHGLAIATAICATEGLPVGQAYTVIPENATPLWIEWPLPNYK